LRAAVGHGGMGTVWRAADTLLRRDVAIKEVILPPGLAPSDRDSMYERTMREARAAAALQHPAVVQVYDVVHENGRPWIVMELLDARSLADMVIEDGPIAPRVVAKIGIALLGALEVAHAHGVLHRDVKPANVLICSDGRCVLTDFGVARMPTDIQLTTPGMVLGSPHFISPERAMGSEFGPPSDLFSLGVTLYTAIEGRPPFDKGDPIETMHAVVEDPPAPPVRAGSLTTVLMGLLEKDPAQRYDVPTARTILRQQLAGPLASTAPPHLMTDPYSVVPAQRPAVPVPKPVIPAAPASPPPSGQIGGRAMLAADESLTGRLAKLRQGGNGGTRRAEDDATRLTPATTGQPTGAYQPPGSQPAAQQSGFQPGPQQSGFQPPNQSTGFQPPPAHAGGDTTSVIPPREQWNGARAAGLQSGGTVHAASGAKRRAMIENAVQTTRRVTGRAVTTVKGWPRNTQLIAAGGVAVVLVLALVLAFSGDDPKTPPPVVQGTSSAAPPAPAGFATQTYNDRGISVHVPKGWDRKAAGVWVDYVDPADKLRKVRILVESSKGTPTSFLGVAENTLRKSSNCPKPYDKVELRNAGIAGREGAVLEYTCGDAATGRHGLWGAVISNGKAYSFYLTTKGSRFEESKPIFDEMLRSYKLEAAG
jgi:serine/threonine protein kinase